MHPSAEGIPAGTVKEITFPDSAIFPGVTRRGAVFVPAQYDPAKPACVYVRQDGFDAGEIPLLESLIAAKEMPVTIGVYVGSGNLHAPMADTAARRNRCLEYDALGDDYVRLLTEEILPFVARTFNLNLSTSGNDRCIAGGSSGGICAFNAAWEKPDAFSRVYANSGSFVAFRGGHEFPILIRKFEPRPIRAYLTTATHDMENCAGDWFLVDQEMDKALKFSGYDYSFHVVEGPHVAGWHEHFSDAMRFLWKDWPKPIEPGAGAPRVRDVITPGGKWELAWQGAHEVRSPVGNSRGEVFFVDTADNKIHRLGPEGKADVFLADAAHADGLAIGPDDALYTVSARTENVMRYDASGNGQVYAQGVGGQYALALPKGGLYVSGTHPGGDGKIWFVKDGHSTVVEAGVRSASGLAYRPDQWLLSVADRSSKWAYSFQMQPDGSLIHKERFFRLHVADADDDAGAESVCYAREGANARRHARGGTGLRGRRSHAGHPAVARRHGRGGRLPRWTGRTHPVRLRRGRQGVEAARQPPRPRRLHTLDRCESNPALDHMPTPYGQLSRRILPILFFGYLINYLDRVNIGFARLTMSASLGWATRPTASGRDCFSSGTSRSRFRAT